MRNSLVISFAEGSNTGEEFLILYEEYQSEEQGYMLKLASFQNWSMFLFELSFPKPTPFELKKSFPDKNAVLR